MSPLPVKSWFNNVVGQKKPKRKLKKVQIAKPIYHVRPMASENIVVDCRLLLSSSYSCNPKPKHSILEYSFPSKKRKLKRSASCLSCL